MHASVKIAVSPELVNLMKGVDSLTSETQQTRKVLEDLVIAINTKMERLIEHATGLGALQLRFVFVTVVLIIANDAIASVPDLIKLISKMMGMPL